MEQAKLEVKKIADKIAAATVNAPFDGKVLSLNIRPGNSVEAFKTIAVVGDPKALELTAESGSQRCGRTQRRDAGQSCACAIGRAKT